MLLVEAACAAHHILFTFITLHLVSFSFYHPRFSLTLALEVNRTIDDAFVGDDSAKVTYIGNKWNIGQDCGSTCVVHPDPKQAFGGTWHDATALEGVVTAQVVINFIGTAVYVYCILANSVPNAGTSSKFSFMMDDKPSGPDFDHEPSSSSDYVYNALVYHVTGLSNIAHTLTVTANSDGPGNGSLMLFDYATYTQSLLDTTQPLPPSQPSVADHPQEETPTPSSANLNSTISNKTPIDSNDPSTTMSGKSTSTNGAPPNGNGNPDTAGMQGSDKKHSVGALIGGILGGVLGLAILLAFSICMKRRRHIAKTQASVSSGVGPWRSRWLGRNGSGALPYPCDILESPISEITLGYPNKTLQPHLLDTEAATQSDTNNPRDISFASATTPISITTDKLSRENFSLQPHVRSGVDEVEMFNERERVYRPASFVSTGTIPELSVLAPPPYVPREI